MSNRTVDQRLHGYLAALEDIAHKISEVTIGYPSSLAYDGSDTFASSPTSSGCTSPLSLFSPGATSSSITSHGSSPYFKPYCNPRLSVRYFIDGPPSLNPATRLRQLIARPGSVVLPAIFDGHSARQAVEAGYQCLYHSGGQGSSPTSLTLGNAGLESLDRLMKDVERANKPHRAIPIVSAGTAGFDTRASGSGLAKPRARGMGLAAIHVNDAVVSQPYNRLAGELVVSREDFLSRIRSAVHARDALDDDESDLVIIAQTNSAELLGVREAIGRMKEAAAAGADVCYVEGVPSAKHLEALIRALHPMPVLVSLLRGGRVPALTRAEADRLGAKLIVVPLETAIASDCLHSSTVALTGSESKTAVILKDSARRRPF